MRFDSHAVRTPLPLVHAVLIRLPCDIAVPTDKAIWQRESWRISRIGEFSSLSCLKTTGTLTSRTRSPCCRINSIASERASQWKFHQLQHTELGASLAGSPNVFATLQRPALGIYSQSIGSKSFPYHLPRSLVCFFDLLMFTFRIIMSHRRIWQARERFPKEELGKHHASSMYSLSTTALDNFQSSALNFLRSNFLFLVSLQLASFRHGVCLSLQIHFLQMHFLQPTSTSNRKAPEQSYQLFLMTHNLWVVQSKGVHLILNNDDSLLTNLLED